MTQNTQNTQKDAEKKILYEGLSKIVVDAFFAVYDELGHGFFEKVYENALVVELKKRGLNVVQQQVIKVYYQGNEVGEYVADVIVERKIILELKAIKELGKAEIAQLLNYLKATDAQVGYLLNFGRKPEFVRRVYSNNRKKHHIQNLR